VLNVQILDKAREVNGRKADRIAAAIGAEALGGVGVALAVLAELWPLTGTRPLTGRDSLTTTPSGWPLPGADGQATRRYSPARTPEAGAS
jgi:hypothetical protein